MAISAAVLVSGGGKNLQAILDAAIFDEIPNFECKAVISSRPEAYALERARNAHVPAFVVDAAMYPNRASFCNALTLKLRDLDIDLVVLAGFQPILNPQFVSAFKNRIINVQPSLMPAFSGLGCFGLRVHELALQSGVKLTGASAYFVTEKVGEGPIIAQQTVAVAEDDTPLSLQQRVMEEGEWKILPQALSLYCQGRLTVTGNTVHIAQAET